MANQLGDHELAISLLERAIKIQPKNAAFYNSLGYIYNEKRSPQKALTHLTKAITLNNNYAEAYLNRAKCLKAQGKLKEAIKDYEKAVALKPEQILPQINLLYSLNFVPGIKNEKITERHILFAQKQEKLITKLVRQSTNNDSASLKKLKIGYVSADFREHSVSYFIEPVLSHHDKDKFSIYCYYNNHAEDQTTGRIRSLSDHWRSIASLSDRAFAELVSKDDIDILIDLSGYTANTRTLAFAYKPAPVQISWLGYPNTTGLESMDYRLTDILTDTPLESEHLYSEKLLRMKECFCCYQPPQKSPDECKHSFQENGFITFGSFNNFAKTTTDVLNLWADILVQIPNSRLVLKSAGLSDKDMTSRLKAFFAAKGIKGDRLILLSNDNLLSEHLAQYQGIDIALDPFPYNGTTTTCEALWMGTPVITLIGDSHRSRVGYSLLHSVETQELAAKNMEEYLQIAITLANDPSSLSHYHKTLRKKMTDSSLMNATEFTKEFENNLLAISQRQT